MADWLGNRSNNRFFLRYVKWPSWDEGEEYGNVVGGSLELSAFSNTKVSGSISFEGDEPDTSNLVRIYYRFSDDDGLSEEVPVATMLVDCVNPILMGDKWRGVTKSGSATLHSVLKILADKEYGAPFTVTAGTQAVQLAVELVESLGLRVNNPDPSAYTVLSDHTFAASDANYLTIVNWLLSAANYQSCWPDEFGVVQMTPYIEPTERSISMAFEEDEQSVIQLELPYSNNWQETKNVCRLFYETEEESLRAWTSNVDPDHKASLPNRGWRESTLLETVSELAGDTTEDRLENLKEMSRKKLIDNSAQIDYVEIGCPYLPLSPNLAISVKYATLDWKGNITNYSIDLGDDTAAKISARRFIKTAMKTETDGEVL